MSKVMTNLDRIKIRNYVDDFIITDRTFEEHLTSMRSFFEALKENSLKLEFNKCNIGKKDIKFFGIMLKIEKLSCVKEVRSFLGMVQFWHKFIKNLAGKTINLTEALKKKGEFQWTSEMQNGLDQLKNDLTTQPALAYVRLGENASKFILYTDASDLTCGFALNQIQDEEKAIAYGSAKFSDTQQWYNIFRKKLYAIKISLQN